MSENIFEKITKKILSKPEGAKFFQVEIHVSIDLFINQKEKFLNVCKKKNIAIVGLVSERIDDIIIAIEELNNLKENVFYPLIGYLLKIKWPSEDIGILALYDAPHSDYKIKKLVDFLDYDENKQIINDEKSIARIIDLIHSDDGIALYFPYESEQIENIKENKRLLLSLKEDGFDGIEIFSEKHLQSLRLEEPLNKIAILTSSRASKLSDIGKLPSFVKMVTPSFEGLKSALKDTTSRIRLSSEFFMPFHKILGMYVEGNFFKNEVFRFNPYLNSILGGKGTGKTSIIELLRFAFNLPYPDELKHYLLRNEEEFLKFLLKDGTVWVLIENSSGQKFLIARSIDDEPRVFTEKGEEIIIELSSSNLFAIDVIGWSEIEYRSQKPAEILKMIDLCDDRLFALKKEENLIKTEIYELGNDLIEIRKKGAQNLKKLKELLGKREELFALKKSEFSQLVENYDVRIKRNFLFEQLLQNLMDWEVQCKYQLDNEVYRQFKKFSKTRSPYVREVNQIVDEVYNTFKQNMKEILKLTKDIEEKLSKFIDILLQKKRNLEEANEKEYKITLKEKRKYGERIKEIIKKITTLSVQVQEIPLIKKKQLEIQDKYNQIRECISLKIAELKENLKKQIQIREELKNIINSELAPDVRLDFDIFIEKPEFEAQINIIANEYSDIPYRNVLVKKMLELKEELINLFDFNWISNLDNIMEKFNLSKVKAKEVSKFFIRNYQTILQFLTFDFSPIPRLSFRGKPVHQLSAGQRCTTVLPILLLLGNHPLVIDQPEDNLDNAYIFEQIVSHLREKLKGKRQIILVTHNPNIPVSGDSEKIFIMQANDSNGWIEAEGYLEDRVVHEKIQKILEGGKEAFILRKEKYGY